MPARPINPADYPDVIDPLKVRTGAISKTPDEIMAVLKRDGVEISYGDLRMLAQSSSLDQARAEIATYSAEERHHAMRSVDRDLQKYLPKILKGSASRKRMNQFHADLLLWTALNEVAAS